MTGRLRYLIGVGLTASSLVVAAASSEFDSALTAALAKSKTGPGTDYLPKYSNVLGKYVASAMDECGPKFPDMSDPAYVVLTIAADGHVTRKFHSGSDYAALFPNVLRRIFPGP